VHAHSIAVAFLSVRPSVRPSVKLVLVTKRNNLQPKFLYKIIGPFITFSDIRMVDGDDPLFSLVFGTQLGQPRHAKLRAVRSMKMVLRTRTHVQRTFCAAAAACSRSTMLNGDWNVYGRQLRARRCSLSSSSTNFIATQVLNKTSRPLCVTYYTNVNATVADSLHCRMICGTVVGQLLDVGQIRWTRPVCNRVHDATQFELDAPAYWKPVQLWQTWSDMFTTARLEDQASC